MRPLVIAVCAACTVGPKLVTVPMLAATPTTTLAVEADSQSPDEPDTSADFTGTWSGRAWQVGNKSYPVTATFEHVHGKELVAHVQYPDQHCSADWKLTATDARHWQGDEAIRTDPFRRCADHGRVTLESIDEDTMNWRWNGVGGQATATLERTQH